MYVFKHHERTNEQTERETERERYAPPPPPRVYPSSRFLLYYVLYICRGTGLDKKSPVNPLQPVSAPALWHGQNKGIRKSSKKGAVHFSPVALKVCRTKNGSNSLNKTGLNKMV